MRPVTIWPSLILFGSCCVNDLPKKLGSIRHVEHSSPYEPTNNENKNANRHKRFIVPSIMNTYELGVDKLHTARAKSRVHHY